MKKTIFLIAAMLAINVCTAQSPVGKWKLISSTIVYGGQKIDTHAALLKQRPCAEKIVYEINADGTYRLNAAASGCDEKYINIQQKLYSITKWKMEGNKFTTYAVSAAVGQTYVVVFSGNKMTCTGTEGQGVIVYQKL